MPIQNSPYQAFAALLSTSSHNVSPAELHGLLLGRSAAGAGFEPDSWLADAKELFQSENEISDNVRNALIGLQEMVKGELTSDDMTVVLLLPTDDAPLPDRATALGEWCQGFLAGFGLNYLDNALSTEGEEVLQDLAAIAHVQDALEESEDGESDYMEVMEYLRVAPLLLFTETKKPEASAAAKPSLH
ncbi:YecA family protein [Pseudomonas lundensis]|uniref:YecA/YgfB family protein n=1 Tax=Pseudomonas lundensis TaxID=86185 RepID=UPI001474738C|nr:YecA family protein [Pseudomonas lundensis]NMZ97920.1 YecA family protein [Pseudomonas lundensis]